ncbi:hypothetical protein [Henriciella aquimarina]|uniref:hypothetical protein n=1 Tax=Henriciella aquimarina TaxID=545261 RepID=UPI0009FE1F09|nr:hypothetical protein [Henriciella aquimarina]
MPSRRQVALISLALAGLALPATAQIQSSGLGDLNAWGASYLERGEAPLQDGLWTGSDPEYLLALMERIDVSVLSPAERALLSRALRSPATAPEGDLADALQQERLRLLVALGERSAAARLGEQMEERPEGTDPDIIRSDARLARGELEVVCAQKQTTGEGLFWAELRALCALSNQEPADFQIEIASEQEGADPWFANTAFAVLAEQEDRPAARYGSGLELALSDLGNLEPDEESLSAERPGLAAQIARDENRRLALRMAAADLAARAGELSGETHRNLYDTLISAEEFEPSNAVEAAFVVLAKAPEPEAAPAAMTASRPEGPVDLRSMSEDWIEPVRPDDLSEDALEPEGVDEVSLAEEQALAVAQALREAASGPADFAARARLFEAALDSIPARADTATQARLFAAAALSARNVSLADKWLNALEPETLDDKARFEMALLEGYASILGGERREADAGDIAGVLVERAIEPAQQAAALRLFALWSGFDMPVPVNARMALAQADMAAGSIGPGLLAAIDAAGRNGAGAEALLTILTQTDGDVAALSGQELATVLRTLRELKADEDAKALAFEAGQLWTLAADNEG